MSGKALFRKKIHNLPSRHNTWPGDLRLFCLTPHRLLISLKYLMNRLDWSNTCMSIKDGLGICIFMRRVRKYTGESSLPIGKNFSPSDVLFSNLNISIAIRDTKKLLTLTENLGNQASFGFDFMQLSPFIFEWHHFQKSVENNGI